MKMFFLAWFRESGSIHVPVPVQVSPQWAVCGDLGKSGRAGGRLSPDGDASKSTAVSMSGQVAGGRGAPPGAVAPVAG